MSLYLLSIIPKLFFNVYKKEYYNVITSTKYLNKLLIFLFLHINTQAKMFVDLVAIDIIKNKDRFVLVYQFLSYIYKG